MDTKDLTIEKVVINGQEVKYALGERQSYKGSPMEISLPIALSKYECDFLSLLYLSNGEIILSNLDSSPFPCFVCGYVAFGIPLLLICSN